MNKNKKLSCYCDSRSYCELLTVGYTGKLSNRFRLQAYERLHDTIQGTMNAPKLYLLKCDHWAW